MREVRIKETRPPHTAVCVVSWANSLNETISATVHVETVLERKLRDHPPTLMKSCLPTP
jgi:hypothetical protein